MATITYTDEASESFADLAERMAGYCVRVLTDDGREFDAIIEGSGADCTGDNFGVRVRLAEDGEPAGDPFSIIARNLTVY